MTRFLTGANKWGSLRGTYQSWQNMKTRCLNPNASGYKAYGGSGVRICPQWVEHFEMFACDMGERPEGMSLDRIDTNGNYEPDNCRWATRRTQNRNRNYTRVSLEKAKEIRRLYNIRVRKYHQKQLADMFGITQAYVSKILLGRHWND